MSVPSHAPMDRLAVLAAGVTVLLWASAFVGIRELVGVFSPGPLALARLTIGTVVMGMLVLRRGWQPMSRRDFGAIVLSGVLWFGVYSIALNEAERHLDAGTASMLINTAPIFIGLFAGLFIGEGLPARLLAGLAVAFSGSVIIGIATSEGGAGGRVADAVPLYGIVLCLVAAVVYALAVVLQKPALHRAPALQVTWLACASAFVACLPFTPDLVRELGVAATPKIAWLAYLGLVPTSIAVTTWAYALRRTSAGRLGVTTYLVPPLVVVMAWLLLGETPPPLALVGGAVCIAGVMVVRTPGLTAWRRRRSQATEAPEASEASAG